MSAGRIEDLGRALAARHGLDAGRLLAGRPFAAAAGDALGKLSADVILDRLGAPITGAGNQYGVLIARLRRLAAEAPERTAPIAAPAPRPLPPLPPPEVVARGLARCRAALAESRRRR